MFFLRESDLSEPIREEIYESENEKQMYGATPLRKRDNRNIQTNAEIIPQIELEPHRVLYDKKCYITLKQENVLMDNYKVEEKQFNKIKDRVEKYRPIGHICKNVRCIETGQVFENAKKAAKWVSEIRENFYNACDPDLIKQCCRGKQKTSYGYHWEFVKN